MLVREVDALGLFDSDGWSLPRGAHIRRHNILLLLSTSISAQVLGAYFTLCVYHLTATLLATVVLLESHQRRLRQIEDTIKGKRGHFRRT